MMHLFLVSLPDMQTFAHLHPRETDSLVFVGDLPSLPAGRYRLFGDITLENGFESHGHERSDFADSGCASQTAV
jgi:hypothetical protein